MLNRIFYRNLYNHRRNHNAGCIQSVLHCDRRYKILPHTSTLQFDVCTHEIQFVLQEHTQLLGQFEAPTKILHQLHQIMFHLFRAVKLVDFTSQYIKSEMRRNTAPQVLHANPVDLLEETLTKKLPLFTHIPDNHHYSRHKQHADKHPDKYAQFEHPHLSCLSLNLHFFTKHDCILPVAHIQFGNTHLYSFTTNGIIQMTIAFQILIGMTVITNLFKIML